MIPRVAVQVGKAMVHCAPGQRQAVLRQACANEDAAEGDHMLHNSDIGNSSMANGPRDWSREANGIISFEEATHAMLGDKCKIPSPDLRHGLNCVRKLVLQQHTLSLAERKSALQRLKAIAHLLVTHGELRHYSPRREHGLASHLERLLAKLGVSNELRSH